MESSSAWYLAGSESLGVGLSGMISTLSQDGREFEMLNLSKSENFMQVWPCHIPYILHSPVCSDIFARVFSHQI